MKASYYLNFARELLLLTCKEFFAREKPCNDWHLQGSFFRVSANPYLSLDSEDSELTTFSVFFSYPAG